MSADTHTTNHSNHGNAHGPAHYVKIWGILLVLLVISICGPLLGIRALTLITAFGIAIVKAIMVAAEFMHLKIEKKYVSYMLITMLLLVGILFFGVAPDVMKGSGQNWIKLPSHAQDMATSAAEENKE
jgi:caa(3)-type oxidase subunit IV